MCDNCVTGKDYIQVFYRHNETTPHQFWVTLCERCYKVLLTHKTTASTCVFFPLEDDHESNI